MTRKGDKIKTYFVRVGVLAFFGMGLFARCANTMAPQGGPRDTLPPIVVATTPEEWSVDFDGKRIFIEFDEYVTLKDQQKEFFTSPMMAKKPTLLIRGKGIQIDIKDDTLMENTTYALNFGSSIVDNNEGNPLNGYQFVFSTGSEIDSMVMSGYTADAYKKDSVSKTFIYFYAAEKDSIPGYDSTIFNAVPDVIARAENNGIFIARQLKPIPYRVYAVQDNNNNQMYEPGVDDIGFLDSIYNPALMPPFNIWFDTMRNYFTAEPQVYFRMFRDQAFKRQILSGQNRPLQHKAVLSFGAHYPQIDTLYFEGIPMENVIVEYLKPTKDSIAYWFNIPPEELPDTIKGSVTYMRHDSVNMLEPYTQDLRLFWKAFESKAQERERENKEKERQKLLAQGLEPEKEPNPFKLSVEASSPLNPEKNIGLTFDYPLVSMDSSAISLIRIDEEEKKYRVRYRIQQDTTNIRRWVISAGWQDNQKYQLEIPEGVFLNVAGQTNDTLRSEFTVMAPDKYGTLTFELEGKTPESQYVLELLDQSGNRIIKSVPHAVTGTYTFKYLDPGGVRLRIVEDVNGNGQWDAGNLVERIQPERVEMFLLSNGEEELPTKAGWSDTQRVDASVIFAPESMDRVLEKIRKEEEVRMRKYYEDLEKRQGQGNKGQSQPRQSFNPTRGLGGMF